MAGQVLQTRQVESASTINKSEQRAGFYLAKEIAQRQGGSLPTLSEFVKALKDDAQYQNLKGDVYWLGNEPGLDISGYCKIDYEKGTITPVSEREYRKLSVSNRAFAWAGSGPLALGVYYDYGNYGDGRLGVYADGRPGGAARVAWVAGQSQGATQAGSSSHSNAELKNLARDALQSIAALESTVKPETLEPLRRLARTVSEIKE